MIILKAWSNNADFNADCDYAFVNLSVKDVKTLLYAMDRVEAWMQGLSGLTSIEIADWKPEFVSYNNTLQIIGEEDMNKLEDSGVLEIEMTEEIEGHRLAYSFAKISVAGVYWVACPKHTEIQIHTATITRAELERWLGVQVEAGS